jgi:hypothetical protein
MVDTVSATPPAAWRRRLQSRPDTSHPGRASGRPIRARLGSCGDNARHRQSRPGLDARRVAPAHPGWPLRRGERPGGPDEVDAAIVATAAWDRAAYGPMAKIGLPQDPGQAGKTQVIFVTRRLGGYIVVSSPETGDKATRAEPLASPCNAGDVSLVAGMWNRAFLDQLAGFPSAHMTTRSMRLAERSRCSSSRRGRRAYSP